MDSRERGLVGAWAILVALTLLSFEGGAGGLLGPVTALAGVLGVALLKMRIVARRFMELRGAPVAMGLAFDAWLVALGGALAFFWLR